MKITINIDCTPAEARQYMGLPDVAPMQDAMLKELQERMMANVTSLQPAEMIKAWFPWDWTVGSKCRRRFGNR